MSEETLSTTPEQKAEQNDAFADSLDMQRKAAERLFQQSANQVEINAAKIEDSSSEGKKNKILNIGNVSVAATLIASGAVLVGVNHATKQEVPDWGNTTKITVFPGEGLFDIAGKIPGSENYDLGLVADSIANNPANIPVINEDGTLVLGSTLVIPVKLP